MIKSFTCSHYRNVNVNNMEFGRINILIGPNNAGKTNLIQAISFLANMIQQGASDEGSTAFYRQLELRGWSRLLQQGINERNITFEWILELTPGKPLYRYELKFNIGQSEIERRDSYITMESLGYKDSSLVGSVHPFNFFSCHSKVPNEGHFSIYTNDSSITRQNKRLKLFVRNNETVLWQVDELIRESKEFYKAYNHIIYKEGIDSLIEYEKRFYSYASAKFDLDEIRKDTRNVGEHKKLNVSGTNFINVLQYWKFAERNTFKFYCNMIKPLFGSINDVNIDLLSIPSSDLLVINISVGDKIFKLSDLSDGTLKAMLLAMLLVDQQETSSVLAIDEPEMNLHPAWQQLFCSWLLKSNNSKQYFISTHSPEILDELTESFCIDDVFVFAMSTKGKGFERIKKDSIKEYLDNNWNLGDLYRAKAMEIGGWPW